MAEQRAPSALPVVSVIITTKNRADLLEEAITSVVALDEARFTLDLVVVDDGSTDHTTDVLARHPVRTVRTTGIGMAGARNLGLQAAAGEFVMLFDDDDLLLPAAIGAQLDMFAEHPEYAAVHGLAQRSDADTGALIGDPFPSPPLASGSIFEDLLTYFPQIGTVLVRTTVARAVGGFDPTLTGDNDWDWNLRIARQHPVGRVPVAVLNFRLRSAPEESLAWRRFPAMIHVFNRQTKHLAPLDRLRLRPVLWRHRGAWAWNFVAQAKINWQRGQRRRAASGVAYALRASPPHAVLALVRRG